MGDVDFDLLSMWRSGGAVEKATMLAAGTIPAAAVGMTVAGTTHAIIGDEEEEEEEEEEDNE